MILLSIIELILSAGMNGKDALVPPVSYTFPRQRLAIIAGSASTYLFTTNKHLKQYPTKVI
jgi:hypothetical protein